MAGIMTSDITTLPESEHMKATDSCHPCKGVIKHVDIDGSATNIGASSYAGWGLWTPDDHRFNNHLPFLGEEQ
eukprot:4097190-Heterocapsa_arctica.AAC.1